MAETVLSDVLGMLRRALRNDAAKLTELALRSKAHWGYDAAFIDACREALTISEQYVEAAPVFVIEESKLLGFYGLTPDVTTLEFLYVDPAAMGRGYGRALLLHAMATARAAGASELLIVADPHAERFYLSMGATRAGEVPSEAIPGRMLPQLRLSLSRA